MLIGAHVSIAGGLFNAPERAKAVGAECFQMFSRSPQGGSAVTLTNELVERFKKEGIANNLPDYYIHAPYYINLASIKSNIRLRSISVIREELERGSLLGAKAIMAHLGSAKDVPKAKGLNMVIDGLVSLLDGYNGTTEFLIENSAGAGYVIGDTFEEIAGLISRAEKKLKIGEIIGVCLDTQHAFASGYDLRTAEDVKATLDKFDKIIGMDRLKVIHCNDSKVELGENKDRHEHIGKGKIGQSGFKALVKDKRLKNVNMIIETPYEEVASDINKIKKLKSLR